MATKILIIEDDAIQLLSLQVCLQAAGFEVLSAMSGEEGLQKAWEEKPEVVLVDIILPGMSGVAVCQRLKEHPETKEMSVLLVTASTMQHLEESSKAFGVDVCLTKPYELSELMERIRGLVAAKRHRTPLPQPS
ncbi:MAG: response regulator [Candidatus Omnitrophota bacterium]|nr:response regulator [Candidatus Omnitrophota bacterium]